VYRGITVFVLSRFRANLLAVNHLLIWERTVFAAVEILSHRRVRASRRKVRELRRLFEIEGEKRKGESPGECWRDKGRRRERIWERE
jgi:hypothetical protein